MPSFITHEPLAQSLFNENHNTAQGVLQPWSKQLTKNDHLLNVLVRRMEQDFSSLAVKMRKPWSGKDVETHLNVRYLFVCNGYLVETNLTQTVPNILSYIIMIKGRSESYFLIAPCYIISNSSSQTAQEALQRVCGGYLAAMDQYQAMVPATFFAKTSPEIEKA